MARRVQNWDIYAHRAVGPAKRVVNRSLEFNPLFITGIIGSGTTLVTELLKSNFEFGSVYMETAHMLPRKSPLAINKPNDFGSVREYIDAMPFPKSASIEQVRQHHQNAYRFHASWRPDLLNAIDKCPNYTLARSADLKKAFPNARFIVIFRDPVANTEGLQRKWRLFKEAGPEQSMRLYEELYERFLKEAEDFTDSVIYLDYDAFVKSPDKLYSYLGEEWGMTRLEGQRKVRKPSARKGGLRGVTQGSVKIDQTASRRSRDSVSAEIVENIDRELAVLHGRLKSLTSWS
jgi:hypothetical protein